MNALLLPGNSPRHAEWIEALKDAVSSQFEVTKTQHYAHWQTGEQWANVEHEINVSKEKVASLEPYVIIAKSIGTVIAAKGTASQVLQPEKLILLGVPIKGGADIETFLAFLQKIKIPVIIVQNTADPFGSFADVKSVFQGAGPHTSFIELPGDTHDYLDFSAITRIAHP